MRTTKKNQIENLIETIKIAHEEICRNIEAENFDIAGSLLRDCQDAAIRIGTIIEEAEGEEFVTVSLLEEYCELVYQIHDSLQGGAPDGHDAPGQGRLAESAAEKRQGKPNARRIQKILTKHLIRIENSVKNDIPPRKEVVFLPYKASMWDSLESVWRAADADPDCDAYVIPIPYYDKNPDGTFREMHLERDLYPAYVPVMDYNAYDFETRHPDMVFIHNPYDDQNYVTSVHPFFYSTNLKKYTDKLVYIPYFILNEIDPDSEQAIQDMEHFVACPGVIHADQVIVQSEAMRQIYIDILTKHGGETSRPIWEKRILGLGSPKTDKVRMSNVEDFDIPVEWKTCLCKEDGSYKRVIFYNTGVGALLQHGHDMLLKMRDVFQTFQEERNEVVLLWRPHPLIEATMASMRPDLWEDYKKLTEQYRAESWGIYDDSSDLNRAIAISDAYYGDPSSVAELFRKAGKPVMIQNIDVRCGEDESAEEIERRFKNQRRMKDEI